MSPVKPPSYRRHANNIGFVAINRKRYYFPGPYNSPESKKAYWDFLKANCGVEHVTQVTKPKRRGGVLLTELADYFLEHAKSYYGSSKKTELPYYRRVLVKVIEKYGDMPVSDFGPLRLAEFRDWLAATGHIRQNVNKLGEVTSERKYYLSRNTVNHLIADLKRVFKWGLTQELIAADQWVALQAVPGLKAGRSPAKEPKPRTAVDWKDVEAIFPHVSPVVKAMILVQWYTGCRPQNVCQLRPREIDRTESPWIWKPEHHKGKWRGQDLVIFIGPRAQEALLPFLDRDPNSYCFSPKEASNKKQAKDCYNSGTYGQAVAHGLAGLSLGEIKKPYSRPKFRVAGIRYWTPHQLRHAKAQLVRDELGIEAAQAVLGHSSLHATQIYAKRTMERAKEIARNCG